MCLQNMIELQVWPVEACVKVDDTVPGVEEGLNAGMWTVGLAVSGNEVGLPLAEWRALADDDKAARRQRAYRRMEQCGAHYVVDDISGLIACLDDIERRLKLGEKP
jgi:phosphonoacetaldehyde hydrolase